MVAKRILLTRPAYNRRPVVSAGDSSTTTNPIARTRARETPSGVSSAASVYSTRAHAQPAAREDEITTAALALSKKNKKELLDRLLLDLQNAPSQRGAADRDKDMWASAVHRALLKVTGSMDGGLVGPAVVRRLVAVGTSWGHVEAFMVSSKLNEITVTDRQAVYNMLAELLVQHARYVARRSGAPLSVKLVTQCTTNLAGVFENSFPGYLEAGLAKAVARQALG